MTRHGARLLAVVVVALLPGCGGEEKAADELEILSFEASSAKAEYWSWITLSWKTRNATKVTLVANGKELELDEAWLGAASIEVFLEKGINTFTLVADGEGGESVTRELMVATYAVQPVIHSFQATPEVVEAGEEVRLSWETEDADMIGIASNNDEPLEVSEGSGSIVVHPTETTIYYLTVTRRDEYAEQSLTVEVRDAP